MNLFMGTLLIAAGLFLSPLSSANEANGLVELTDEELNSQMGLCQVDTNVTSDAPASSTSPSTPSSGAIGR